MMFWVFYCEHQFSFRNMGVNVVYFAYRFAQNIGACYSNKKHVCLCNLDINNLNNNLFCLWNDLSLCLTSVSCLCGIHFSSTFHDSINYWCITWNPVLHWIFYFIIKYITLCKQKKVFHNCLQGYMFKFRFIPQIIFYNQFWADKKFK